MDRSPGFASAARDSCRPVRTRCRCGWLPCFASPRTATRWLILQKARRHGSCPLRLLVGARFQVLFHSPPGVLFTFPSRYWSTIGHRRVFRLGGWSPLHLSLTVLVRYRSQESVQAWRVVPPASHRVSRVRRYSGTCRPWMDVRVRGSSPVSPAFPCRSARASMDICAGPSTPRAQCAPRFGLVPVRSPLLGESRLISLPPGTEMFQFSGLPPSGICVLPEVRGDGPPRVRPFGDLRVQEHVPLAAAYRSLSRPSSASCAKASTVRPYHLHIRWLGCPMLFLLHI